MAYVNQLHRPPEEWRFGGVPLPSLLELVKRQGNVKPVIAKAFVDLKGAPFKRLAKSRSAWMKHSAYDNPGPLQYEGPIELTDSFPLILQ